MDKITQLILKRNGLDPKKVHTSVYSARLPNGKVLSVRRQTTDRELAKSQLIDACANIVGCMREMGYSKLHNNSIEIDSNSRKISLITNGTAKVLFRENPNNPHARSDDFVETHLLGLNAIMGPAGAVLGTAAGAGTWAILRKTHVEAVMYDAFELNKNILTYAPVEAINSLSENLIDLAVSSLGAKTTTKKEETVKLFSGLNLNEADVEELPEQTPYFSLESLRKNPFMDQEALEEAVQAGRSGPHNDTINILSLYIWCSHRMVAARIVPGRLRDV